MEITVRGLTHMEGGDSFTAVRHGSPAKEDCQLMEHFINVVSKEIKHRMINGIEFDIEFKEKGI